jgi:photosystem II stability/assembly factor-like uncharacterized protein
MHSRYALPFLLFSLFILASTGSFAQVFLDENQLDKNHFQFEKTDHSNTDWWQEMNSPSPNVLVAERLFNTYFESHYREKSLQKKLFIRWLRDARLSQSATGQYIPFSAPVEALPESSGNNLTSSTGSWQAIGPNYAERTTCGTTSSLTGGFCDQVYINPYNTQNLFAGYSYGGLWVSQDQGQSWTLTDAAFANGTNTYANRDYYYGDIEASSITPSLVYAATEAGLLKSTNSGMDWTLCPQLNRIDNPNTRPYYLALSRADSEIVLASFGREVYRSADGGNTWTLAFDNSNGGPNHTYTSQYSNNSTFGIYQRTYNFFALEQDHDDDQVFYLGAFNSGNEPCVYKSTDGGVSFQFLVNLNTATGVNLPNSLYLRTLPAKPDLFYVFGQFAEGNMYRFNEDGSLNSQNVIDSYVEAASLNWANGNDLYVGFYGASSIMKSINTGISFTDMTSGYGGCPKYVHPDVRDIDVVGDLVFIGSDGGMALSTDAMNTVESVGREVSSIDLWGFSSSAHSDILSAGCDHGPTKIRRYAGDNGWISRGGGDAGQTSVNQSNDHWIYFNHGYGIFKTELSDDSSFLSTEAINPGISLHRVAFHPNFYQTAYGTNGTEVKVSYDNFSSFSVFYNFGETVNRILIAPENPDVFYVLLSNNKIKKSIDGGTSWTTITPPVGITNGQSNITDIAVGDDPNQIWASYGNWQTDTKVVQSQDGGASWVNISSPNLPITPVSQIVYQRGTDGGLYLAFAGQSGVYYRNNTMPAFEALGSGLPMMGYIQNIYAVPGKGKFRMGSSRGAWEHDLYEESTQPIANFAVNTNVSKCPLTPIRFYQNCFHSSGAVSYAWTFEGGNPATSTEANPSVTFADLGAHDVSLTITDEFGNSATKTFTDFITVENSICDGDEQAGKMIDLPLGQTNRPVLGTIPITGNEFTITAWVKLHGLQNSFAQIVSTNSPNTRFGFGFAFMNYNANSNLIFTSPNENYWVTSSLNLEVDQWHYVAITYSPSAVKIYVDGQEPWVRTGNFQEVDFSQGPFYINNDIHNQNGNFHGQIDEIAFFNYALSQEEIREKRHLVKQVGSETGLMGYYQFNQYDAASSALYEVVSGQQSVVQNALIDPNSPIPVGGGAVHRIANVGNGVYDFTGTDAVLEFPSGSAAPEGELVVSRIDANPNLLPPAVLALSPQYWVVNNYGTNLFGLDANLTLRSPGFVSTDVPGSFLLHKRSSNDTGDWTDFGPASSLDLANDGMTFNGINDFSQFIISDAMLVGTHGADGTSDQLIRIAPNPVKDQLQVHFLTDASGRYSLQVYNELGELQLQQLVSAQTGSLLLLDTSKLPAGMYFLSVQQGGQILAKEQFIKAR